MKRLLQFCLLAAFLAVACAGCGNSSKPAEPKIGGGNAPDPNVKRIDNGSQGDGKTPVGGGSKTSVSAD